ncbi:hypothetical protein M3194_05145 [Paenibacillus glycanilyticus]|uniref:RHS repeat domain-containing protein n=1 Tax=Paenibacillus glycanilyticus TaxID=126569 RepID=UPI0020402751|nr:RHS repeat-associated core domain-containing protein [Paenibacillus glycanilyticus]MCM3626747.1 hypothetical protein [Paenibacillus glycanilyticus]
MYKKTIQNGKELLTQVIDPMNRKTTYDYSISTAKFDLLSTTPTTQNPFALITGVTYPTGAKTVFEYETTPFKRYTSASSVNEVYRIATRKDVVSYSDQTISESNRMSFVYPTDMGSSYDVDMNFTTKTFNGQVETLYTYKKDYIDNQTQPMIYNTNIEASDLTTKKIINNTYDEAKQIPAPTSTTTYFRTTSAESEHNMDSQTYDDYGNILTSTNPLNQTIVYTYDPVTHLRITEKWPASSTTSLFVEMTRNQQGDVKDYKLKQNDTSGSILQHSAYEYDSFGNVITTTDYDTTKQAIVKFEYDAAYGSAFLTKQTSSYKDSDGIQQSIIISSTYDNLSGNMMTYTDGRNNKSSYQYDKLNRLTKETYPDNSFVSVVYDDTNNQTTRTNEAGAITRATFDGLGREVKSEIYDKTVNESTPTFKAKNKTGYDALSRKIWDEDASGNRTAYTYDNRDRIIKVTNPDLTYSQISYDDILSTVTETDEESNSIKKLSDRLGRVTSVMEMENGSFVTKTKTQYDNSNNITQVTTYLSPGSVGSITKYSYDLLNQLRIVTTPLNEVFTYDYDQLGNSTGITYPDNKKISQEYNELGNIIKYTDESGNIKKMYYDAERNLSKLVDRNNQTFTYQYDNRNRLLNRYGPSETVSYQYYPDGKRKSMTDNTGLTLYGYNNFTGLLTSKTYPDGKTIQYGYDQRGNRTDLTDPFGRKIAYGYDSVNRISTVKTDDKLSASYDYYRNDKIKTITHGNGLTSNYEYDGLDLQSVQLKNSSGVINSYKYVSDWSGNITQRTENGQTNSYTYNALGQILTNSQFNEIYGYNVRGNRSSLTSDDTPSFNNFSYMYDEWNQLTKVTDKDSESVEYTYNGDGQLYERFADGLRTRYYWDDQRLIAEATITNTSINPKASYVYGNGLLERINATNQARATYLLNGHGDVVELRDNNGNILNSYTYDIWGKPIIERETVDNPFRYSSEYWDKKSGLQYLRTRWYDPSTARFITEDTYGGQIDSPLSLNRYTYVQNNPLTNIDPSGHWCTAVVHGKLYSHAGGCDGGNKGVSVKKDVGNAKWTPDYLHVSAKQIYASKPEGSPMTAADLDMSELPTLQFKPTQVNKETHPMLDASAEWGTGIGVVVGPGVFNGEVKVTVTWECSIWGGCDPETQTQANEVVIKTKFLPVGIGAEASSKMDKNGKVTGAQEYYGGAYIGPYQVGNLKTTDDSRMVLEFSLGGYLGVGGEVHFKVDLTSFYEQIVH